MRRINVRVSRNFQKYILQRGLGQTDVLHHTVELLLHGQHTAKHFRPQDVRVLGEEGQLVLFCEGINND